jgi:hypothetical protein
MYVLPKFALFRLRSCDQFSSRTRRVFCSDCASGTYANTTGLSTCPGCARGYCACLFANVDILKRSPHVKCPLSSCLSTLHVETSSLTRTLEFSQNLTSIRSQRGGQADRVRAVPARLPVESRGPDLVLGVPARHVQSVARPSVPIVCAGNLYAGMQRVRQCCAPIVSPLLHHSRQLRVLECRAYPNGLPCLFDPLSARQNLNATACLSCPAGTDQVGSGSLFCSACLPGRANPQTGVVQCPLCAAGKFNAQPGQLSCEACPVRTFSSLTGARACVPCSSGTFGAATGLSACLSCGRGSYQPSTNSSTCLLCPVKVWHACISDLKWTVY